MMQNTLGIDIFLCIVNLSSFHHYVVILSPENYGTLYGFEVLVYVLRCYVVNFFLFFQKKIPTQLFQQHVIVNKNYERMNWLCMIEVCFALFTFYSGWPFYSFFLKKKFTGLRLCLLNGINKLNSYSTHAVFLFFVHHTIYCSSHGVLSWITAYSQRPYNSNNFMCSFLSKAN